MAVSSVLAKLGSHCFDANATVAVPNSLGPGELLVRYGTDEQRGYFLPRLADGTLIPCFGLTGPHSGSDATSLIGSYGTVEKRNGVLGVRCTFEKRYITLAPVAGVVGIGLDLKDPNNLLGGQGSEGFTVALLERGHEGLNMGPRHMPLNAAFMNGTVTGEDVWVPMSNILGGQQRCGFGWHMFVECLAEGRGVSLPAGALGAARTVCAGVGAYSRVRKQFRVPIAEFGGIQEALARAGRESYIVLAGTELTNAIIDNHEAPMVLSSIMKQSCTERGRRIITDGMDILGGAGISQGKANFVGSAYMSMPVAITVEGANILTRSLIVFGQGAIRAHPYLLKEMQALADQDVEKGLAQFDAVFWTHVVHTLRTARRAFAGAWTDGLFGETPVGGPTRRYYRRMGRYAAAFALASDMALLTMGGELKRREMLSARFGDILSELYMMSAALKRWEDEGREVEDLPLLDYVMQDGFLTIERRLKEILDNFPNRPAAWLLKVFVLPFGVIRTGPRDATVRACARLIMEPSATRDRLTEGVYIGDEAVGRLDRAFELVVRSQPIHDRLKARRIRHWRVAAEQDLLTGDELALQAHLFKADAKDRWSELETRWDQLKHRLGAAKRAAAEGFDEDDEQRGDQHNAEEGERERDQDCPRDRALADGLFLAALLSGVTHGRTISGSRPAAG
jgi:acyl-CoA dehydrogenase